MIVILFILQALRYTKITNRVFIIYVCVCLIYIYICVLKDMIQEALRWISGGVPYICICMYIYICICIYIYMYMYMYIYIHIYIYTYIYISIHSDCNSGFPTNPPGIFADLTGSQDAFPRALIHFLAVSQEASPSEAIEEAIRGRKPCRREVNGGLLRLGGTPIAGWFIFYFFWKICKMRMDDLGVPLF